MTWFIIAKVGYSVLDNILELDRILSKTIEFLSFFTNRSSFIRVTILVVDMDLSSPKYTDLVRNARNILTWFPLPLS